MKPYSLGGEDSSRIGGDVLIIYGRYTFAPKIIAYKADFCRPCESERVSHQVRSFHVLHLFWVPLLPLGFWKRWVCSVCGKDPHVNAKTRRPFKIAGAVLLAVMTLAYWAIPLEGDDPGMMLAMRIIAPLLLALVLWSIAKQKPEASLAAQLATIQPLSDSSCRLCGAAMVLHEGWVCSACGVRRL